MLLRRVSFAAALALSTSLAGAQSTAPTDQPSNAPAAAAAAPGAAKPGDAGASGSAHKPGVEQDDGKWTDVDGNPSYHVEADGTVDWYTFSGFRRYHSECHVCHGPDGEGSSYAPALKNSVTTGGITYEKFQEIVASGKQDVSTANNLVMPAFGTDKNVMCYLDDIYIYLRARGDDAIPRGRPAKKADKPQTAKDYENSCIGP